MTDARTIDFASAAVGLVTVLIANALYVAGLPAVLDPLLSMDPLYIQQARQSVVEVLRHDPAWGPLYALWLKPWVALLGDPIAVYTANLLALSVAISTTLYLHVLLLTRRAAPAVIAALFFLVSDLNVPLAGKVSAFALLLVLCGLTAAAVMPAGVPRLAIAAIGVLLASYVRPELYPAAVCLCVAAVVMAARRRRNGVRGALLWPALLWPAIALALVALLAAGIGSPLFSASSGDDRLLVAFREHFAWNWMAWNQPGFYLDIWQREFGSADSIGQAVVANPIAIAHHLGSNLLGTAAFLARSAFDHYPLLAPVTVPWLVRLESLAVSALVVGSVLVIAMRAPLRREVWRRYGQMLFIYAVIAAWTVGSAIVIYPLARYLLVPAVLLLVLGAVAATLLLPWPEEATWRARLSAAALCLIAVPKPFVLPSDYAVAGSPFTARLIVARPVMDTVAFVRGLSLSPPVQVLTFTDGLGELLGPGFEEVKVWQKGEQSLADYMRERGVDVIITTEAGRGSFFVKEPYWTELQQAPEAHGFVPLSVPNAEHVRIYVRAERLRAMQPAAAQPSS